MIKFQPFHLSLVLFLLFSLVNTPVMNALVVESGILEAGFTPPVDQPATPPGSDVSSPDPERGIEAFTNSGSAGSSLIHKWFLGELEKTWADEFKGTGPYSRLYSCDNFSWESVEVKLPTSKWKPQVNWPGDSALNRVFIDPDHWYKVPKEKFETACLYLGGKGYGKFGTHVDAGLQYSPTYDHWTAFISVNGQYTYNDLDFESPFNFIPGQTVHMVFCLPEDNQPQLWVFGRTRDKFNPSIQREEWVKVTWCKRTDASSAKRVFIPKSYFQDWPKDGHGISLKIMTSIAQPPLPDKSKNSYISKSFIYGVVWSNMWLGVTDVNTIGENYPPFPRHVQRWVTQWVTDTYPAYKTTPVNAAFSRYNASGIAEVMYYSPHPENSTDFTKIFYSPDYPLHVRVQCFPNDGIPGSLPPHYYGNSVSLPDSASPQPPHVSN